MKSGFSFEHTKESIYRSIRTEDNTMSSCYKISMAFLFSAVLISLLAGVLRLSQDYIISKSKDYNSDEVAKVHEVVSYDGEVDLQFVYSSPVWLEFINNTNPFTLSAAQAATLDTPLLEIVEPENLLFYSPHIRVGLFYTNQPHTVSATGNYQIVTKAGEVVLTSRGDKSISIWYDRVRKLYYWQQQNISQGFSEPFQVVAMDESALVIETYRNPPKWNWSLPDNKFRGALELRYSPNTGRVWMINELPLEYYLMGLGETRSTDNFEYLEVMTVVGRSYALWHMLDNYKHDNEYYNLDAYWDQVYRGYDNELRHPELVQAIEETYGEVVMYEGEVAVTPYFARSNGRTRSWSEVWYQDPYPWVKSVMVPQEQGYSELGHGVGLSAVGAMLMVDEGMSYVDVIEYFYNDIEVAPAY